MSYKLNADQIRTINKEKYRFSVNGKEWQSIESMLQVSSQYINCLYHRINKMCCIIDRYL